MEWQFRKILESTENYRSGSTRFMAAIQKNSPGVLKTIIRQIELIMSDPNANIFSKVLAMRFARDIMILGRQDVINQLTKLVPHMLKVCSYRIQTDDQNRGQTYFYDHPQYLSATPSQKEVIQSYGSTYFILNLESIYHWGNWIKVDQSGNQSIYSKGLNSLVERGVKFPNNFNYYKNSDTQKFKNTYRVEFFSEQSADFQSSMQSSFAQSDRSSKTDNQIKQFNNVEGIMNALQSIQPQNPRRFLKLEGLRKNAVTLLEGKYNPSMVYYGKDKSEKKWLQNFIIIHNLLTERKISYQQFLKRARTQIIEIPEKSEFQVSPRQLTDTNLGFKKAKTSAKREVVQKVPQELSRQHETFQQIINKYKQQIRQLNQRIELSRSQSEVQKNQIIQNYEDRMRSLKQQIAQTNSGRNQVMIKENQNLKEKLYDLERSLQASRSREVQINNTIAAYDTLKLQNQNLKKVNRRLDANMSPQEKNELLQRIKQLQRQLQAAKSQNQIILSKLPADNDINRKNKQISQLTDEIAIYKNSLQSERNDFDKKYKILEQKYLECEKQIKNLKQKNKVLQKKLDLKDIEAVELGEQVKLFQALGTQQKYSKSKKSQKDDYSSKKSQTNQRQIQGNPKLTKQKPRISYSFKKYEDLKNISFENEKQRYLRFCRCSLKKKDLLLKQNQLEVGLISEPLSSNQVKYIIHLTNTSDSQINQINIFCETANQSDLMSLETSHIFCLQSNQQEKINLSCRSPSYFLSETYEPIFLIITYIKNSRNFQTRLVLPFHLFKTLEIYKIDRRYQPNLQNQYSLTFPYSQKILPEGKYLSSYFPSIQQTANNVPNNITKKYECDLLWRETGSRFRLEFQVREQKKLTIVVSPLGESRANSKQQQLIEQDLMSFLEFCFRKQ